MLHWCWSLVAFKQKDWGFLTAAGSAWRIKISGSREEDLTHEQGNMSITFEGQGSSGINLYAPLWNTSLRFTAALWSTSCLRPSEWEGTMSLGAQLWLRADPVHCSLSGAFSLYFWTRLLNGFLIDCDPDQWLAGAGLLSQYWIYSVSLPCLQPALLPSLSGTEGGLSMTLSSHSSVCTLQPFPDPVNVLSVSYTHAH